jgi:hypothetical protein
MSLDQLDKDAKDLLLHLYRETGGDPSVQVSMYESGASIGLDRDAASRMTEDLIGWEMVELRTLSGGIGISENAVRQIESSGLAGSGESDPLAAFGKDAVIGADARQAVEQITIAAKDRVGALGLAFDLLSEVMADLKSIDAQLESPRPKTAIVRECFRSLKASLEPDEIAERIGRLVKE